MSVQTGWITVRSDRPLWWHWEIERGAEGHALSRAGAFREAHRALRRVERRAARTERRRARTVRTSESRSFPRVVR